MAPLKILICGGGIAGPALAYWLARSGHRVVIIERYPDLRAKGAQIDLREPGISIVKHMGIVDTIRSKLVEEDGFALVDSAGKTRGFVPPNKSGQGAQTFTSEFEIMRGDLVRILYDTTKDEENVEWVFNKSVDRFDQDESQVTAHFSDGTSDSFDLLVGADGQGSRIRKAILPPGSDPYRHLGVYIAYYYIPREPQDTSAANSYLTTGGRMIFRRSHNPTDTQVYFFLKSEDPAHRSIPKASVEQQKEFFTQKFRDAGWQADRFLEGMKTTEDWYCQEVVQVKTDAWSKNRVVLLGDAAACPSPFSGMGTTAGLIGAYVLAGEITRHSDNLPRALRNYDEKLRPFVNSVQKLHPKLLRLAMPDSWWGIKILYFVFELLCWLRVDRLVARFSKDESTGWQLPAYPELKPKPAR
ncbi:hypothetical protein M426DRAFT_22233 [Hypoxylon sp. CI-4A]|nr:hypothetical protein M426DRAFT_22233 [Hypoxylon sp. CI-4A]